MKHLAILGSTGSIGKQTLEIVREFSEELTVDVLGANKSVALLEEQVREFRPKLVCVYDEGAATELKSRIADLSDVAVVTGMEGLVEGASYASVDLVVTAVVGMIGIQPTIAAIRARKDIALANKETLVTAGHLIMPLLKEYGVNLYPVDSEHSAIFQSLQGIRYSGVMSEGHPSIKRILLTASGGPFRGKTLEQMKSFTVEDALKHPNWAMGSKITIDSATMVNKGLEMMEARWLFGLEPDQITVVVHPQSVLHSAVEFTDGAVVGQMGTPDMKLPIQYAIFYPERRTMTAKPLDLFSVGQLEFLQPDYENFPAFAMAEKVMREGGSVPTVYNAANEFAVARFLNRQIAFTTIGEWIELAVSKHKRIEAPTLSQILETEQETYELLKGCC